MLAKGEKSILAYFTSNVKVEKAIQELKSAGLPIDEGSMTINLITRYNMSTNNEITGMANSAANLTGPTLYSSGVEEDENKSRLETFNSVNLEADSAEGIIFLLTIVTRDENVAEALRIIKENGGRV